MQTVAKLADIQIKAWIKNSEYFEGRSDGDGLYISHRQNFAIPIWRIRYKIKGTSRWMTLGGATPTYRLPMPE